MKTLILLVGLALVFLASGMPVNEDQEMNSEGNSCYIYHGAYGICKAKCAEDEKAMAGMGVCEGDLCCYKTPW
nr:magnificamide1-3 [Heteractis magnifica]